MDSNEMRVGAFERSVIEVLNENEPFKRDFGLIIMRVSAARIFLHEVMHLSYTLDLPADHDTVDLRVIEQIAQQSYEQAKKIPESWALYALWVTVGSIYPSPENPSFIFNMWPRNL